jgi:hypothetical protein
MVRGLTLVTANTLEFRRVEGLDLEGLASRVKGGRKDAYVANQRRISWGGVSRRDWIARRLRRVAGRVRSSSR